MTDFTVNFAAEVPSWGAKLAHGPAIVVGGVEVLPVAFVVFGFGAGELGGTAASGPSGDVGGGGGLTVPIGVYVGQGATAQFRPNTLTLALAAASVIGAVGVMVSSVLLAASAANRRPAHRP